MILNKEHAKGVTDMREKFLTKRILLASMVLFVFVAGCNRTNPEPILSNADHQTTELISVIDIQLGETIETQAEETVPLDERGQPFEQIGELIHLRNILSAFEPTTEIEMVFVEGGLMTMQGQEISVDSFYISKFVLNGYLHTRANNWAHERGYGLGSRLWVHNEDDALNALVGWTRAITLSNWFSLMAGLTPVYWLEDRTSPVLSPWDIINSAGDDGTLIYKPFFINWDADGYRLPTEAEWEFAARGGNESRGYRFSGSDTLADVLSNFWGADEFDMRYVPGQMKPNELGLHDMSGQASEWVLGPWTEFGGFEPLHNPGRISIFDFTEPFYLVQKGGNLWMGKFNIPYHQLLVRELPFRPEERIRFQPHTGRPTALDHVSVRLVRRTGLHQIYLGELADYE
jgi:hypothetical protein